MAGYLKSTLRDVYPASPHAGSVVAPNQRQPTGKGEKLQPDFVHPVVWSPLTKDNLQEKEKNYSRISSILLFALHALQPEVSGSNEGYTYIFGSCPPPEIQEGDSQSLGLSDDPNNMIATTIHKSKGLEFDVVLVPYLGGDVQKYNDLLWAEPNPRQPGFPPLIPVPFSRGLKYSFFRDKWEEETLNQWLDTLNLLYVLS